MPDYIIEREIRNAGNYLSKSCKRFRERPAAY